MPLLEAFVDETQMMKYKLVTLPRGTSKLPVINLSLNSVIIPQAGTITISPQTLNYLNASRTVEPSGYLMTIGDSRFVSTFNGVGIDTTGLNLTGLVPNASGANLSQSSIGTSFSILATSLNVLFPSTALAGATLSTTLTCIGRDSGARITIPFILRKT